MSNLLKVITILFFLFIVWIIFSADTGQANIFFDIVNTVPHGDKLGHFFLFGLLTLLLNLVLNFKSFRNWKMTPLGSILVFVFVTIEELSQAFFPNRTMDINDFIANVLGILVFTFMGYFLFKNRVI